MVRIFRFCKEPAHMIHLFGNQHTMVVLMFLIQYKEPPHTSHSTLCRELDWQAIWPIVTQNLSDTQIRQESRLTSVDLNLKLVSFCFWNKHEWTTEDILSKYEKPLELRHTSNLSWDVKEPQNARPIYCCNFSKNDQIWKLRLFHTRSSLRCLVCQHVVSVLFALRCNVNLHSVRTPLYVGHSNSNGGVFVEGQLSYSLVISNVCMLSARTIY